VAGNTYVLWGWTAGQGNTVINGSGSITSSVSANPTAGFSIVSYTGNGSPGATIGHGLGVAPSMIIIRSLSPGLQDWPVGHAGVNNGSSPWNYKMLLDLANSQSADANVWNNTAPSSAVFTVGPGGLVNLAANSYIAYCLTAVSGYSAFGSYTGTGTTDGPYIYTGFRPRWVMFKRIDNTGSWNIFDSVRLPYNLDNLALQADNTNTEATYTTGNSPIDILSNGFKLRGTGNDGNASSTATYIYAAFAENPFKYALAR